MTLSKILSVIGFIACMVIMASTSSDNEPGYRYRQAHKADGEPVNVVEVMRPIREDGK